MNSDKDIKNISGNEENFDIAEAVKAEKKAKKEKSLSKEKFPKSKRIKNQLLWKKGSYSIAITALVIVFIVAFNILISAIADRYVLEYDMTIEKKNSISEDNINFIKKIDDKILITVCASEEQYINAIYSVATGEEGLGGYGMSQDVFVKNSTIEYLSQTQTLLEKYVAYNDNIKLQYVDPDSSAFAEVQAKYKNLAVEPGGIIVARDTDDENNRYRVIGFDDVYALKANEDYAAYGYTVYEDIAGNNLETALTTAIAYTASHEVKKAALIAGHCSENNAGRYIENLRNNNFEIDIITDEYITKIDSKYDAIIIPGATKDFAEEEIVAISEFLDNDEELGKGMIVFVDATAKYLTNFYDFLSEWGAEIKNGVAYETNTQNCVSQDPVTFYANTYGVIDVFNAAKSLTSNNAPMTLAFEKQDYLQAATIIGAYEATVVTAPKDFDDDWKGANAEKAYEHAAVIEAVKSKYNSKDEEVESRVAVLGSIDFLDSVYSTSEGISNDMIAVTMTERIAGISEFGHSYIPKQITEVSFLEQVTESSAKTVKIIFMIALPIVITALGIFVYIKRRNAE